MSINVNITKLNIRKITITRDAEGQPLLSLSFDRRDSANRWIFKSRIEASKEDLPASIKQSALAFYMAVKAWLEESYMVQS